MMMMIAIHYNDDDDDDDDDCRGKDNGQGIKLSSQYEFICTRYDDDSF